MSQTKRGKLKECLRRWQRRLGQLAILFTIAAIIALAWSLLAGPEQPAGGSSWTVATATASTSRAAGSASGSRTGAAHEQPASPQASGPAPGSSASPSPGQSDATESTMPRASSEDDIPVYIVGAVGRPGVYIVRRNSYLYELVEKAGGLTPEAAGNAVNLALKLTENQMVRIPTKAEASDPLNPGPFATGAAGAAVRTININTATSAELENLPGIGPATAAAIIADRTKNGPFRQPEDLMRVAGVKESRYAQLEPLISVR